MSTKVYTGFRCTSRTHEAVLADIERLGRRFVRDAERREASALASLAMGIVDRLTLAPLLNEPDVEPQEGSAFERALSELRTRQATILTSGLRDPAVDVEVSVSLWHIPSNGRWVGRVIEEGPGLAYRTVIAQRTTPAYGYWNNTDRPANVRSRAWKKRGQDWDATETPTVALTFAPSKALTVEDVLEHLPSLEQRAVDFAEDLLLHDWTVERPLPSSEAHQGSTASYRAFRRALREPGLWQDRWIAKRIEVEGRLLQNKEALRQALVQA